MNNVIKISLIVNLVTLGVIFLLIILEQQVYDAVFAVFAVSSGVCVFSSVVTAVKNKVSGKSAERNEPKRRQAIALLTVLIILTVILTISATS